jgi:hypothetical protein
MIFPWRAIVVSLRVGRDKVGGFIPDVSQFISWDERERLVAGLQDFAEALKRSLEVTRDIGVTL